MISFTHYQWQKFRSNKRAFWSLRILTVLLGISFLGEFIANDKPLLVYYEGDLYSPIIKTYPESVFGGDLPIEANYYDPFIRQRIEKSGWMIWPIIPYHHETLDYELDVPPPVAPSAKHWLGTDDQGRDLAARLIYGMRSTLVFAFALTFFSAFLGTLMGSLQGYFGGWLDLFGQRLLEVWSSIPVLLTLIILCSVIEPTFWWLLGIMGMFKWMAFVPVVRAEFLRARNLNYVRAARAMGVHPLRIIQRHILPNVISAPLTLMPFVLTTAIVMVATLEFLGFTLPSHIPSLGEIINQGKNNLYAPWIGISGFVSLSSLLILLIFIGEGLRDTYQHKQPLNEELL